MPETVWHQLLRGLLTTRHPRMTIVAWRQALAELSESPEVITQKPAFIVFMEGGDKEEQVRIVSCKRPASEVFETVGSA